MAGRIVYYLSQEKQVKEVACWFDKEFYNCVCLWEEPQHMEEKKTDARYMVWHGRGGSCC